MILIDGSSLKKIILNDLFIFPDHEEYVECAKSILNDLVFSIDPSLHDNPDTLNPNLVPEIILNPPEFELAEIALEVNEDEDVNGMVSCNTSFRVQGILSLYMF